MFHEFEDGTILNIQQIVSVKLFEDSTCEDAECFCTETPKEAYAAVFTTGSSEDADFWITKDEFDELHGILRSEWNRA